MSEVTVSKIWDVHVHDWLPSPTSQRETLQWDSPLVWRRIPQSGESEYPQWSLGWPRTPPNTCHHHLRPLLHTHLQHPRYQLGCYRLPLLWLLVISSEGWNKWLTSDDNVNIYKSVTNMLQTRSEIWWETQKELCPLTLYVERIYIEYLVDTNLNH